MMRCAEPKLWPRIPYPHSGHSARFDALKTAYGGFCCKSPLRLGANDDSVIVMRRIMGDQGQLFYCFRLEEMVPADQLVREIAACSTCLGFTANWGLTTRRSAGHRSMLMIRMLMVGYVVNTVLGFTTRRRSLSPSEIQSG